jgi:hypothetical protein
MKEEAKNHSQHSEMKKMGSMEHKDSYQKLMLMAGLSFISMYILMYAMVNTFDNVFNSLNQFYMAGLMTAPMVIFEIILMSMMYPNKRRNTVIIVTTLILGLLFFGFIRQQAAISDEQFLRSMIPHHAGAILMCEQAPITDPEIQDLCRSIISSQQGEIDQMKAILDQLDK